MTQEVLKLALEALEAADWYIDQLEMIVYCVDDEGTHENRAKVQAAITAIKEALAQPAQEPVACMVENDDYGVMVWPIEHINEAGTYCEENEFPVLLYAAPPQRTGVGLTDEEYNEIWRMDLNNKDIMDKTIAKLKEKNHE